MLNYSWYAVYLDGSVVPQFSFSGDGSENLFGNLDLSHLRDFFILRNGSPAFSFYAEIPKGLIHLNNTEGSRTTVEFPGSSPRLIYFRRNIYTTGDNTPRVTHVLGLQSTVEGSNQKIMFGIDDTTSKISVIYD